MCRWLLHSLRGVWFSVNLPGEPTVEETTIISQRGDTMPMRMYRANDGASEYSVTVIDYADGIVSDVRASVQWET